MANLIVKDGASSDQYLKKRGAGSDGDPFVEANDDIGQSQTTVAIDGDLRNIDADAEAIALDVTANISGAASGKYSITFLFRLLIKLKQYLINSVLGAPSDAASATGSINAKLRREIDLLGGTTLTANDSNSNPTTGTLFVFPLLYNGTGWERRRGGQTGATTSPIGWANTLPFALYNISDPTLSNGQWAGFQLDVNGYLKTIPKEWGASSDAASLTGSHHAKLRYIGDSAKRIAKATTELTATLTRPGDTNGYGANDEISSSTSSPTAITISNVAKENAGSGVITRIRITTTQTTFAGVLRIHIFKATPTPGNDNAAFVLADDSNKIDEIIVSGFTTGGAGSTVAAASLATWVPFTCGSGSTLIGLRVETMGAFTPANAQVFKIFLGVEQY